MGRCRKMIFKNDIEEANPLSEKEYQIINNCKLIPVKDRLYTFDVILNNINIGNVRGRISGAQYKKNGAKVYIQATCERPEEAHFARAIQGLLT
ncbi:MAG: hypothetical protein GY870_07530 [archaeon]|nr:hypothetical protein [archaeon]